MENKSKRGRKPKRNTENDEEVIRIRLKKSLGMQLIELAKQFDLSHPEDIIHILIKDFLMFGDNNNGNKLARPVEYVSINDSENTFYSSDLYYNFLFEDLYDVLVENNENENNNINSDDDKKHMND